MRRKRLKKRERIFRIFFKPVGGTEIFGVGNDRDGTNSAVTCELCGTTHPETCLSDDCYGLFHLLGLQGVLRCCGAAVDRIFREWGEEFTEKTLGEFIENPLADEYYSLRHGLKMAVEAWYRAAKEKLDQSARLMEILP